MSNKKHKVKLGLLMPIGAVGTAYTALLLAAAIAYFAPLTIGTQVLIGLMVVYWFIVQFSTYGIELRQDESCILLSKKLIGLVEVGKKIPIENIEYYFIREAKMSVTVRDGTVSPFPMTWIEENISSRSGVVEIKLKEEAKYRFIAEGKMKKMIEVGKKIFEPTGIPFHKEVVTRKTRKRRRR